MRGGARALPGRRNRGNGARRFSGGWMRAGGSGGCARSGARGRRNGRAREGRGRGRKARVRRRTAPGVLRDVRPAARDRPLRYAANRALRSGRRRARDFLRSRAHDDARRTRRHDGPPGRARRGADSHADAFSQPVGGCRPTRRDRRVRRLAAGERRRIAARNVFLAPGATIALDKPRTSRPKERPGCRSIDGATA